jgi:pimeloyl-ACP methyl ester carboxylesterase
MIRTILCTALIAGALTAPANADDGTMPVGDVTLPYVDDGEGIPVVFLHGAISDLRVWEPYRARIAEDRRFVSYTQRYFGTSP